jgi:hypothetical protein
VASNTAAKLDALKVHSPAAKAEITRLEKLVEKQHEQIERYRKAKFTLPAGGKRRRDGKSFLRVIIPDSHGAHIDREAAAAMLGDLEELKPAEIVLIGDHLDASGFLAQHQTLSFVPETEYTFEDDVKAANTLLDEIQKRAPGAEIWQIEGNHEVRIERWIIKQTLANNIDAKYLRRMFGPEVVMNLESRGINYVKTDRHYHGLAKRGTIKLGKCLFHHGYRHGVNAARETLSDLGTNVVCGHTHRIDSCIKETADCWIGAWIFGCLCQLHPLYYHSRPTNWAHGYGLQIVQPDGEFMSIAVPIVQGKSLLVRWA